MFGILAGVLATVGVAPSTNVTYKAAGVCIRGIALSIVAVHIRRSVFLGMHAWSWERRRWRERSRSIWRICMFLVETGRPRLNEGKLFLIYSCTAFSTPSGNIINCR